MGLGLPLRGRCRPCHADTDVLPCSASPLRTGTVLATTGMRAQQHGLLMVGCAVTEGRDVHAVQDPPCTCTLAARDALQLRTRSVPLT